MAMSYTPSGRIAPLAFVQYLAVLVVICPLVAIFYAYGIRYVPLVYVNFILTLIVGFGVSYAVSELVVRMGKVRNPVVALLMGVFAGAVTLSFAWAFWLVLLIGDGMQVRLALELISHPIDTFDIIQQVLDEGTFSFKSAQVSGIPLLIIWVIEGGIFLVIPATMPFAQAGAPFSEDSMEWARERHFRNTGLVENAPEMRRRLELGEVEAIHALGEGNQMKAHCTVTLYECGNDRYISLTNRMPKPGKNGIEYDDIPVVNLMKLRPDAYERLIAAPAVAADHS